MLHNRPPADPPVLCHQVGWWLFGGTTLLVVLHLVIASGVTGPIVSQDESGYLGNARWLAGLHPVPEMGEASVYAWGYSVLIAPLARIISDPAMLYRAVQVLNSVLLASLFPLLWLLLRQVGQLSARTALVGAGVGSVYPATLVHSANAWSENLLAPLTVVFALSVWWTLTERPTWQRLLIAPVAVWLHAAHPRYLAVLALTVVGLVLAGWTRRLPRRLAAAGIGIVAAGWLGTRLVSAALVAVRWPDRSPDQGSTGRLLRRLIDPRNASEILGGMVGESWYLAVASLGLAAVGVIAIVWWLTHDGAIRRPLRTLVEDPALSTTATVVLMMAALFITSVSSFVSSAPRVDHQIYGRYNESFAPLLVAAGAAAVVAAAPLVRARLLMAGAGLTLLLGLVLRWGRGPDFFDGEIVWNNISALHPLSQVVGPHSLILWATAVAVVALAAVALAARLWPAMTTAALGLVLSMIGSLAIRPLVDFSQVRYAGWDLPVALQRVAVTAGVNEVGLDPQETGDVAVHLYPYWLPDLDFIPVDDTYAGPIPDLVVARPGRPALGRTGAAIVVLDARNELAVWAQPGPVLERLRDRGAVLPDGFPAELPHDARPVDIQRMNSADGALTIRAGHRARLALEVTHAGTGFAWPNDASWPLPGVVRVGYRWHSPDGSAVESGERASLPDPLWPGDSATVGLDISAIDPEGKPLPPGRYVVGVDLVQEGFTWFHSAGDEPFQLHVDVTPN